MRDGKRDDEYADVEDRNRSEESRSRRNNDKGDEVHMDAWDESGNNPGMHPNRDCKQYFPEHILPNSLKLIR